MEEKEFEEILEEVCSAINFSSVLGINKNCIREYMNILVAQKVVDFNVISLETLVYDLINFNYDKNLLDVPLVELFVSKEEYEARVNVFNPVIYERCYHCAEQVQEAAITFESKFEYYSGELLMYTTRLDKETDELNKLSLQEYIKYYTGLLEALKVNATINSVPSKKRTT